MGPWEVLALDNAAVPVALDRGAAPVPVPATAPVLVAVPVPVPVVLTCVSRGADTGMPLGWLAVDAADRGDGARGLLACAWVAGPAGAPATAGTTTQPPTATISNR
jgi:hypothetical protein